MKLYKVVQTDKGPTIAHLLSGPTDATLVFPDDRETQVRADRLLVEYIENNENMGWGPVDGRTVYKIGEVTEAHSLNEDESVVSGAGLHAFTEREDARKWMRDAQLAT